MMDASTHDVGLDSPERDTSADTESDAPADGDVLADARMDAEDDAGAASCFFEERWEYADTAEMIAANTNDFSLGTVSLETGILPDGTTGQFMRATLRGDGTEDETNFDLPIVGAAAGETDEVWVELYIRFDSAWRIGSDDKTFFISPPEGMGTRWEIHYANGRSWGGPSGAPGDFFVVSEDETPLAHTDVWDGEWHRHRVHLRFSSASGASDGAFRWWFDDQVLLSESVSDLVRGEPGEPIDTGAANTYFASIRLGANADPTGSGVRDWGPICIHTSDPGW